VELYRIGDRWAEPAPRHCPRGHRLGAGQVLVGSQVCGAEHGHHRTHACRECGATVYTPPMTVECTDGSFDGRGRS
jgi:hypothetical protein